MSNIYKIKLSFIEDKFTQLVKDQIIKPLPDLEISIGSKVELNDVVLAMLINKELDKVYSWKNGILFDTEYFNQYDQPAFHFNHRHKLFEHTLDLEDFPYALDCLKYESSEKVDTPCKWHIEANLLSTIGYVALLNGWGDDCEGYLLDTDENMFFDAQHSGFWHTGESNDAHSSVQVSGTVSYKRETGEFSLELCPEYELVEVIFKDEAVLEYMKKITKQTFETPDFRKADRFDF